jgi:hypothetical protein
MSFLQIPLKEGLGGERRPKDRDEDRVTLQITLLCSSHICFYIVSLVLLTIFHAFSVIYDQVICVLSNF